MRPERRAEDQPLRTVLWKQIDEPWMERCTLIESVGRSPAHWTLEGTVIGTSKTVPFEVTYQVYCEQGWATRGVLVGSRIGTEARNTQLWLGDDGGWSLEPGEVELPELAGALDVDLGFTPATNTLPIRRLALQVGESREIRTAWVRFPELTVEPLPQRYTRLAERRYLYESLTSEFKAELEVDELGLVVDYQGIWQRVAESSGPAPPSAPTG